MVKLQNAISFHVNFAEVLFRGQLHLHEVDAFKLVSGENFKTHSYDSDPLLTSVSSLFSLLFQFISSFLLVLHFKPVFLFPRSFFFRRLSPAFSCLCSFLFSFSRHSFIHLSTHFRCGKIGVPWGATLRLVHGSVLVTPGPGLY